MGGRGAGSHSSKGRRGTITERQHDYLTHLVSKAAKSPFYDGTVHQSRSEWTKNHLVMHPEIGHAARQYANKKHPTPKGAGPEAQRAARLARKDAAQARAEHLTTKEWNERNRKRKRVKGFIKDPGTISRLSKEEASTYIDYLK